ncbi:MAG TPA: ATP-binding cassette domain-containing protein [Melioribacteraceae bacterium]|nr:ATP-binding cassette domain-containing protein [Melioribacteraceae bacterium]
MELSFNIEIKNDDRKIVKIEDYTITKNKITFLFGESGIGKSLISKSLFGLVDPEDLNVKINGIKYQEYLLNNPLSQEISNGFFVFQEPSTHLNPLIKLSDQLNEGDLLDSESYIEDLLALWKGNSAEEIKKILNIYPRPYRPSGGEKQRVLCLMAIKKMSILQKNQESENSFFVFDEPTGSLDNYYRNLFLAILFQKYTEINFTCTFITHDYSIISFINKNYKNLINKIEFKELYTFEDNLRIKKFTPEIYINWVKSIGVRLENVKQISNEKVLFFNSSFSIFNNTFKICKDANYLYEQNLVINSGDIVYLKAPSGEGKTTICKIIMGLIKAEKFLFSLGNLTFNENTSGSIYKEQVWGKKAVMVFQHADEALNQKSKVKDIFKGLKGYKPDAVKPMLLNLFDEKDITDSFLNKKVSVLSGGQKQKLNILRGLFLNTSLVILDEPVNGMDFESIKKVIDLIEKKRRQGAGILLISHNEEIFDNFVPEEKKYYLKK